MSEKIPRYRAYTIDGQLCRDCDSNTLKELNKKKKKKMSKQTQRHTLCGTT